MTRNTRTPKPDPMECSRCGRPHGGCTAHNRAGDPCRKPPIKGAHVCASHGGKTPAVQEAAARRVLEAEARASVARFGLRQDIAPADALLEEVARSSAMVAFYEAKIRELDPDSDPNVLVWGITKQVDKRSSEHPGVDVTREARPIALVQLWMAERKHLAEVAAAAVRADAELHASQAGALVVMTNWPPANPAGQPAPTIVRSVGSLPATG
jgi:hypothetical protein